MLAYLGNDVARRSFRKTVTSSLPPRFAEPFARLVRIGTRLAPHSGSLQLRLVPRLRSDRERWYVGNMSAPAASSEPSFAQQLLAQADALYNFARYLCRDAARAEDLMQDTFARALQAEPQFARGSNLKAWLFRILRNAYIDGRRRERHGPLAPSSSDPDPDHEHEAATPEVWLRGDIEIAQLRGLVARDIEAALSRLSEDARAVILLDLEGCTETEIALVMEVAVGTVKSRLARARAVLREQLQEYAI